MAIYPHGRWRPLPENATAKKIKPRAIIEHTAVDGSGPTDLRSFFARDDVHVESHFWIPRSGVVDQFMDTERQADCNLDANPFAISIETEDDGRTNLPLNPMQETAMIRLLVWLCDTHDIPAEKIKKWDGAGIGWHSMWGAPSKWTPVKGKTCPGSGKIAQLQDRIIPAVAAALGTTPPVADNSAVVAFFKAVGEARATTLQPGDTGGAVKMLQLILRGRGFKDVPENGVYDAGATLAAVKFAQAVLGHSPTGIVKPAFWDALLAERQPPPTPKDDPAAAEFLRFVAALVEAKKHVLRQGDRNEHVKLLQAVLNKKHNARLIEDGIFGEATARWVREFQRNAKITADGIVGPTTWALLTK